MFGLCAVAQFGVFRCILFCSVAKLSVFQCILFVKEQNSVSFNKLCGLGNYVLFCVLYFVFAVLKFVVTHCR